MMSRPARPGSLARLSACVALVLALSGCAWLYGPAVELPEDVDEAVAKPAIGARALLRAQHSDVEVATWGPALYTAVESLGASGDAAQEAALQAAIRRAYAPQRLFDRMATSVALNWDSVASAEVFSFYRSWLGRRVLRALSNRRDGGALADFRAWSERVDLAAESPRRIEVLRRIDRALLSSQTAVWLNRAMLDAGLAALSEGAPPARASGFRGLRARYAGEEPGLYPLAEEQVLRWNLYVFKWLSDADLERYASFAESPSAQWWVVSSARAYRVTLAGAGEDLFQALRLRGRY